MHAMRIARAYTGRDRDREVRGPVPRRPRLRPDQRVARRHERPRRPGCAGPPRLGTRHPGCRGRHDHPRPLQQHRCAAPAVRATRRGDRRDHRRAGPRERPGDPAQAGLPPGDAGADRGIRDPADLRRGQDRVPLRQGRRGRVLRRDAGPGHLRQGDGQRLSGRGVRRSRGGHERPARQGQPRRHVRRQPRRRGGRGQDADDPARHRRARGDPCDRAPGPGRPARGAQPDRPAVPLHRPSEHVRDHVLRGRGVASIATGRRPTTSCTTRSPSGCMPGERCRSRIRASRGSSARRTPRATSSTGSSRSSPTRSTRHSRRGRTVAAPATSVRRLTRARSERTGRHGPRRQRGPIGRPGGGPPARARREPGRGRGHRAGPSPRPAQVHRVAAARHAPEAGPGRAGRRDRQVPPRPRRHPPGRARRTDARPAPDRPARA